jgi:hypothetical protein
MRLSDLDPTDNPSTPIELRPALRVWTIRRVAHHNFEGQLAGIHRGERVFAADAYSALVEREEPPLASYDAETSTN